MLSQPLLDKLSALRLSGFRTALEDPEKFLLSI